MSVIIDSELQADPFNLDSLVENLVYHETDGHVATADPLDLERVFITALSMLKMQLDSNNRKIKNLESEIINVRQETKSTIMQQEDLANVNMARLLELDERINFVVTKVIHMGHQLESRSGPRVALFRARLAANHLLCLFKGVQPSQFGDIETAADISGILLNVVNDGDDFPSDFKNNVNALVSHVEEELLKRFTTALTKNDDIVMARTVLLLSDSGKSKAEQIFIDMQLEKCNKVNIFETSGIIVEAAEIASSVFTTYCDRVVEQMITGLYNKCIKPYVFKMTQLPTVLTTESLEQYLQTVANLQTKASELRKKLSKVSMKVNDLDNGLFGDTLLRFANMELRWLEERLQADVTGEGGSQEISALLIDDTKKSVNRLRSVFGENDPLFMALTKLLQHIYSHVLHPLISNRSWDSICEVNNVVQMLEQYLGSGVIENTSSPGYAAFIEKKRDALNQLEILINNAIDQSLDVICAKIRSVLSDQKKAEFRSLDEVDVIGSGSQVCFRVCDLLRAEMTRISSALDAENLRVVQEELGIRFHHILCAHVQRFEYSLSGGLLMLQDVSEYKRFVVENIAPSSALVRSLFSALQSLMNLVVVVPENLSQFSHEQRLNRGLSDDLIDSFVMLRLDQKSGKKQDWLHKFLA